MKTQLPIRYIIVEGPDLAGKSTFIQQLHKVTGFKYNIQDRSCLSMLCYARQYSRDIDLQRQFLHEELSDLNNFFIVLLPSEEVLLDRLAYRGDEFQNSSSVATLRNLFVEETESVEHKPNVLVIRNIVSAEQLAEYVSQRLRSYESPTIEKAGAMTSRWITSDQHPEMQLKLKLHINPAHDDAEILKHPHEGEYYSGILERCCAIIQDELDGKNPYSKPQDLTSRRFFYSSDSCISSIHFLPRDGSLKVLCTLRSTDVNKNGSIDTRFLAHLSAFVARKFKWPTSNITLFINFNSAHVRKDLE